MRGGNRPGAGRPATGAMPTRAIRCTDEEYQRIKEYLKKVREGSKMQANGKLSGDLGEMGVEVFVEDGLVVEVDEQNRVELPDTPENRLELIADAKRTVKEWQR